MMTRKTSLWSELQRERERRERAAQASERAEQQMIRQLTRDQEQAERRATRADAAERRRQEQLGHDAGAAAAKEMKAQLDSLVEKLRTLLTYVLLSPPQLPFAALKRTVQAPPFSPGNIGKPTPAPRWEDFAPPPPGMLSGLVGGKGRHARAVTEAHWQSSELCSSGGPCSSARQGASRQLIDLSPPGPWMRSGRCS